MTGVVRRPDESSRSRRLGPVVARALAVALLVGVAGIGAYALGRGSVDVGDHAPAHATTGRAPGTPGPVDVGFAQDMAVHHDQGVLLARLALSRATPTVRPVAEAVLLDQSAEVGLMRGWLRLWDAPAAAPDPMAWMGHGNAGDHGDHAGHGGTGQDATMPGMASSEQVEELYALRGERFDTRFLQLMVRHHQGALLMTRAALDADALAVTHTAARAISTAQLEEIGAMRALLAAAGARPLPAPTV